jgi:hypothetical protein
VGAPGSGALVIATPDLIGSRSDWSTYLHDVVTQCDLVTGYQLTAAPVLHLVVDSNQTVSEQGLYLRAGLHDAGQLEELPKSDDVGVDRNGLDRNVLHVVHLRSRLDPFDTACPGDLHLVSALRSLVPPPEAAPQHSFHEYHVALTPAQGRTS